MGTSQYRFYLSSLGTSYAKADFSNAMTVSFGNNGYAKFPNGLLIQYSGVSGTTSYQTVYFPISFYDTNYALSFAQGKGLSQTAIVTATYGPKYKDYFTLDNLYLGTNLAFGHPGEGCHWIAIGRWK